MTSAVNFNATRLICAGPSDRNGALPPNTGMEPAVVKRHTLCRGKARANLPSGLSPTLGCTDIMARVSVSLVLILLGASAMADLSDSEPEELCALLSEFGIETSPNESPGESPMLCYTTAQPGSIEGQYDFIYGVVEAESTNTRGLHLRVRGRVGNFIGRTPHQLFLDMSQHLLSQFYEPHEVVDVMAAIRELGPNERGRATGRGLHMRFYRIERVLPGLPTGVEFELGLTNVCSEHLRELGRTDCLDAPAEFTWRTRRDPME